MSLTLAEVEHIADLARLELTAEEKERYREQLSAILEYAARLQPLDTSRHPAHRQRAGRAGCRCARTSPSPGLDRADLLRNAPQVEQRPVPRAAGVGVTPCPTLTDLTVSPSAGRPAPRRHLQPGADPGLPGAHRPPGAAPARLLSPAPPSWPCRQAEAPTGATGWRRATPPAAWNPAAPAGAAAGGQGCARAGRCALHLRLEDPGKLCPALHRHRRRAPAGRRRGGGGQDQHR